MIEMVMFLAAFDAVWAPCLENPTFFEDGMSKTATLAEDFCPPTNYFAVVRYVNSEERTVNLRALRAQYENEGSRMLVSLDS